MLCDPTPVLPIDEALRSAAAQLKTSQTPLLDARVLLKFATGFDDAGLVVNSGGPLPPDQASAFFALIERRAMGEPIAYITGVKEFWSLEFRVSPDVLIPRDDSECLIEAVTKRRSADTEFSILDLGAGSGCLLCALLAEFPNANGVGVDLSPQAAIIARDNCERLSLSDRAEILVGDWSSALDDVFDIIIANPPYIPEGDRAGLPVDVVAYEPGSALFAGEEGFDAYCAILADAPRILAPEGIIVFEAGDGQAARLAEMVTKTFPKAEISVICDLQARPRGVLAEQKSFAEKD